MTLHPGYGEEAQGVRVSNQGQGMGKGTPKRSELKWSSHFECCDGDDQIEGQGARAALTEALL